MKNAKAKSATAKTAKIVSSSEWQFDESTVESALLTGESAELLQDYFGPENYREVKQLARDAAVTHCGIAPLPNQLLHLTTSVIRSRSCCSPMTFSWCYPVSVNIIS